MLAAHQTIVLGIETSCDETAVATVRSDRTILSERLYSQFQDHAPYGGVVPEIAARAHINWLDELVRSCLEESQLSIADLSGIAATAGPGLIGGLATGLSMAKAMTLPHKLPLFAINHLEGHALTARLTEGIEFPYLFLLASGGHCQILLCHAVGRYSRLGTTLDDALGEAYDKIARMMGLGYPGGPAVERHALSGDPRRFDFPRSMTGRVGCHFSFSGLKAAVRRQLLTLDKTGVSHQDIDDVCASFEAAVVEIVEDRLKNALADPRCRSIAALVIAGGVAANQRLRAVAKTCADTAGVPLSAPPLRLCGDNAVMIAWAGLERLALGLQDPLDISAKPRWPLDPNAEPAIGAGVKA